MFFPSILSAKTLNDDSYDPDYTYVDSFKGIGVIDIESVHCVDEIHPDCCIVFVNIGREKPDHEFDTIEMNFCYETFDSIMSKINIHRKGHYVYCEYDGRMYDRYSRKWEKTLQGLSFDRLCDIAKLRDEVILYT